jgi:hypothetical protein
LQKGVAATLNRFPWSKQMTTRIPGQSPARQGAPSLVEPQSKDDALLHTWFPKLGEEEARDLFCARWRQTGLPLSGNYEAAKKLYDRLFPMGATRSKTFVRPRSLSAAMPSESEREPKSLRARAVHVPSAHAPAPAPQDPEIYIDLTDFLAASVIEVKTEEAPAPLGAKSGMRPEDEALCEQLDKRLRYWTYKFAINKPDPRPTYDFREEFTEHCEHLFQITKICFKGADDQNALLRKHVSAHISDLLSVAGQCRNFWDLEVIATAAEGLLSCYPDAAPCVDFGHRLVETFRQFVTRPDENRRSSDEDNVSEALCNAIVVGDVSSVKSLQTIAFQYCYHESMKKLLDLLRKRELANSSRNYRSFECFKNSLEQTVQRIRNLSMRGSDRKAAKLFGTAVHNAHLFSANREVTGRLLEAYQALSWRAKYLMFKLKSSELLYRLARREAPSSEEADTVLREIEEFARNLFALPEVSNGGEIVSIIKKLEEAFAQLSEPLAGNVAALLHSHIKEFLESASTSSESWDERGARHEALLGALNYASTIEGAIKSLVDLLSTDEVRDVRSWIGSYRNPITLTLNARLGIRDKMLKE